MIKKLDIPQPDTNRKRINPFLEVYKKNRYRTGQKSLTSNQVYLLLSHVTDLIHLGLFQLAIATGIRREDIVRIRLQDINFEDHMVTYYESKKSRTRTVPIPLTVTNTLRMIVKINKNDPYIFTGFSEKIRNKGHMTGRTAYNVLQKYLAKAGLKNRPFHSLRATCIKLCQHKGWSIEQTAELVGDTIRVIQEHYTTPSDEEMKKVATEDKPLL